MGGVGKQPACEVLPADGVGPPPPARGDRELDPIRRRRHGGPQCHTGGRITSYNVCYTKLLRWFGDLLTCTDWAHIWLNEGFASYAEALWAEHDLGRDEYEYEMWDKRRPALDGGKKLPIVYRTYKGEWEQFDSRAYPKGAWVVHMLRCRLGEELFWTALRVITSYSIHYTKLYDAGAGGGFVGQVEADVALEQGVEHGRFDVAGQALDDGFGEQVVAREFAQGAAADGVGLGGGAQFGAVKSKLEQVGVEFAVVLDVLLALAVLDLVERRLGA